VIIDALSEDAGGIGDITTLATISEDTQAEATFLSKADGVIAGLGLCDLIFEIVDPKLTVKWSISDGQWIERGKEFGLIKGSARSILVAERIALNFMQRMSGIATATRAMVTAAASLGGKAKVLETRKTVPCLRLVDKWAVLIGGGQNHRIGLFDMMMIKDNHIAAAGGIKQAVHRAASYLDQQGMNVPVEVEVRTLDEVKEVLEVIESGNGSCITRIMLDNMAVADPSKPGGVDVTMLIQAITLISDATKKASAGNSEAGKVLCRMETEASGNINLDSVSVVSATGVTFVSVGALTHSVKALDISLNIIV
jgi:nicotinate-nucleotide pyrophosphorylase (carboxylating)